MRNEVPDLMGWVVSLAAWPRDFLRHSRISVKSTGRSFWHFVLVRITVWLTTSNTKVLQRNRWTSPDLFAARWAFCSKVSIHAVNGAVSMFALVNSARRLSVTLVDAVSWGPGEGVSENSQYPPPRMMIPMTAAAFFPQIASTPPPMTPNTTATIIPMQIQPVPSLPSPYALSQLAAEQALNRKLQKRKRRHPRRVVVCKRPLDCRPLLRSISLCCSLR